MQRAQQRIASIVTWVAATVAVIVAISFPLAYFAAAYNGLAGVMQARADGMAMTLNRLVSSAPEHWQYQEYRLKVQLQRLAADTLREQSRILDGDGRLVVSSGPSMHGPFVTRWASLYDSGRIVGRVEVSRSYALMLLETAASAAVGLLLAAAMFLSLRWFPLRALNAALAELQASRAALVAAQRLAHMGSWEYVPATRKVSWSEGLFDVLRLAPRATPPALRQVARRAHPADRERVLAAVRKLREAAAFDVEFRLLLPDGEERVLCARNEPLVDASGKVVRIRGTLQDVTEAKRSEAQIRKLNESLEQRVQERTAALRETIGELEAFSYTVAHDLRAPIRSINSFSHLLSSRLGTQLDATSAHYLRRVTAASARMARLIDDLLHLARVGRTDVRRVPLDLSAMARVAAETLRAAHPERRVTVDIAPGLTVSADPGLMRIVLDNLFENAWKFTSAIPRARVELTSVMDRGRPCFVLRDNGVGFDMRYAHKLFGAFQRLHNEAEYPGTGIGLVTVYRILRRHGATIWLESRPGRGTSVYFCFEPAAAPAAGFAASTAQT